MSASWRWLGVFVALVALVVTPFVLFESGMNALTARTLELELPMPLLFLGIVALQASDVVLPIPSSVLGTASGAALGVVGGTLATWIGLTLSCVLGYWIGRAPGRGLLGRLVDARELARAEALTGRLGPAAVVLLRAVPVLAEVSAIGAGMGRMAPRRFMALTGAANLGIAAVYAVVGAYAVTVDSFLLAFAGSVALPALGLAIAHLAGYRVLGTGAAAAERETAAAADAAEERLVQRFSVSFEYPVLFTEGVFDPGNPVLVDTLDRGGERRRHRLAVFLDRGLAAAAPGLVAAIAAYVDRHGDRLDLIAAPEVVPGGEAAKNDPALLAFLQGRLLAMGLDRHSCVVAAGGGAMLDVVGLAAATVHRGLRLVRLPSTVLAQNDAAVGVKNGVNAFGIKNALGTFAPPFAVIGDRRFLETLDARDRRAGLAEAVKVAVVRDRPFFAWLEDNGADLARFEPAATAAMIRRCARLHLDHIARGDPFETGSKRPLDFGHWAAHKLESLTAHRLNHGEAVAIGMALDCRLAVDAGLLAEPVAGRVAGLLEALGFRLWDDALADPALAAGLDEFRKHMGGDLALVLLLDVGRPAVVHQVTKLQVDRAVGHLRRCAREGRPGHAA